MSIPAYLDSSVYPFNYIEKYGLVDVDDGTTGVITTTRAQIVGGSLNWTEPSTALFKTPVDSAGRFLDVLITRISSTVADFRVRNQAGVTVCDRRIQLGTGTMRIFASTAYLVIELCQTNFASSHIAQAWLLDMAPDLNSDHALYVAGNGRLTNTSTDDSNGNTFAQLFAIDNGAAAVIQRLGPRLVNGNSATFPMMDAAGKWIFRECQCAINFGGTFKWAGRLVHSFMGDSTFNGGDERKIYIDINTIATFKMVGLAVAAPQSGPWIRKS